MTNGHTDLSGSGLTLGYDRRIVNRDLGVSIPPGSFTVIIGLTAFGKSTLLHALNGILSPEAGIVVLDGKELSSYPAKALARRLGLLPQTAVPPDAITVVDLVSRGRYPYQRMLRQWSAEDEQAV